MSSVCLSRIGYGTVCDYASLKLKLYLCVFKYVRVFVMCICVCVRMFVCVLGIHKFVCL